MALCSVSQPCRCRAVALGQITAVTHSLQHHWLTKAKLSSMRTCNQWKDEMGKVCRVLAHSMHFERDLDNFAFILGLLDAPIRALPANLPTRGVFENLFLFTSPARCLFLRPLHFVCPVINGLHRTLAHLIRITKLLHGRTRRIADGIELATDDQEDRVQL